MDGRHVASPWHIAFGLFVGLCVGISLSGRLLGSVIRAVTGWNQSFCFVLGIWVGLCVGAIAGASFAKFLG